MKLFQTILIVTILLSGMSANAQSTLKKANKQYDLYAFNLAIKSYRMVLDKQPGNVEALGKIADCYRHLNQMNVAAKYYAQAIKSADADDLFVFQYGLVLKALGQYDAARRLFLQYAQKFPVRGNQYAESCVFAKARINAPFSYVVKNEFANSAAADFGVALLPDERVVYASGRTDILPPGSGKASFTRTANNQLFITEKDKNGFLKRPELLRIAFGHKSNEGPIAYSLDGKWVAITKNNFVDGTRQIPSSGLELSLYVAEADETGNWNNPTAFPYNGSGYSTGFPAFSPDGKALYFASDGPDGFGGFDIYVSYRLGNTWSAPENLGQIVNSQGNEITPYLDGSTLYFASDWHQGFGGFDIFRAEQTNGSWGSIYHLGTGVNSSRDDYGFVFNHSRNMGYFVSNRLSGKGAEDIYRATKDANFLVIKVMNASDSQPIEAAVIDFSACREGVFKTDASGIYSFRLMEDLDCNAVVRKEGYSSNSFSLSTTSLLKNRNIEILLTKDGESYQGKVVNRNNGGSLEGVLISATNSATNKKVEARSNREGDYSLPLQPQASYVVRFSKPGFLDLNWTVLTGGKNDPKLFETVTLLPSGTYVGDGSGNGKKAETIGFSKDRPLTEGYAVQVAALAAGKALDLSSFERKLEGIGNVYSHQEGGKNKIRVGIFPTKEKASKAKRQVRAKGYKQAFLVPQITAGLTDKIIGNQQSEAKTGTSSSTTEGPTLTKASNYRIRLAAYQNPRFFEESKVSDIGEVESYRKGKWTIMLLSGFDTKGEADRALRKVKAKGFNSAYIVQEENGELKKVN